MTGDSPSAADWPLADAGATYDLSAEQALLGGLMAKNKYLQEVKFFLKPEHFADPMHGRIYAAICKIRASGQPANPVTLKHEFKDKVQYLLELTLSNFKGQWHCLRYAEIIVELFRRREALLIADETVKTIKDLSISDSVSDTIAAHCSEIAAVAAAGESAATMISLDDAASEATIAADAILKAGDQIVGVPMGIAELDVKMRGMRGGQLIVLAARTGMGKSAVAIHMAKAAAQAGHHVAYFSMEMPAKSVAARLIASESGIPYKQILNGPLGVYDLEKIVQGQNALEGLPIGIDPTAGLTTDALRAKCEAFRRKADLGLIVVDHIGLMKSEDPRAKIYERMTSVSNSLKQLSQSMNIPVLALCQINRNVEARDNKRPTMSDLRDSGAIEQDADAVILIYREEYYLWKNEPALKAGESDAAFTIRADQFESDLARSRGRIDFIVDKNRDGDACTGQDYIDLACNSIGDEARRRLAKA